MKFNKNEFGWKEKVSINTDELVTKNDIPHYNEILITEISGDDYRFFRNNNYFNMSALNLDETKSYVGKDINITDDEEYTFKFVYDKEANAFLGENSFLYIYNHKSYNGENFVEDVDSAVLTFDIIPMVISEFEGEGYFKLYEVEKLELDNKCLPDNVSIPNSLTVGTRIGDIGEFSVSEGDGNTATGNVSHAEGAYTTASGNISHAEGGYTTASGDFSHAECDGAEASGVASHAEGKSTTARGDYSHAEGNKTTSLGDNSHIEGSSFDLATNIIQDLSSSTSNDDILTAWNDTNGFSLAKGESSHVEGKDCLALGNYSHAEGNYAIAIGVASHVEGMNSRAKGGYSHAEGNSTKADNMCSHAEGNKTTANGNVSHAEGYYTIALGDSSHIEGKSSNLATDKIIDLSSSTDNNSIITKWETSKFSLAKGEASHVEGKDNLALGDFSHAEGSNTTTSGVASHAEGDSTTASGVISHAEGFKTTASGNSSHAEGFNTTASGNSSHAEGEKTIASGQHQHVQGKYNINDTENKYAHIVGNGRADTARSNAHTLDWQGNGWYAGKLSQDGTPTEDKDLTTKKYVDDIISNILSFNESGELVVTINGVSKIFVPKQ